MIDPITLTVAVLAVSSGLAEYSKSRRVQARREERGAHEEVRTVHLHNPEALKASLDPEGLSALQHSADVGAYVMGAY